MKRSWACRNDISKFAPSRRICRWPSHLPPSTGHEFRNVTGKPKTAVHKLSYNQSWSASTHDKYYNQ